MPVITSRQHPLIKQLIQIEKSHQYRKKNRLTVLDGEHLIQVYQSTQGNPRLLITSESHARLEKYEHFITACFSGKPPPVTVISDSLLRAVSPVKTPSGMLALIDIPANSLVTKPEPLFSLLLEDIQDPGNLGTILRTAAAARVRHIYLSRHCADIWSPKTLRAAMGAHFLLNMHEQCDLLQVARQFDGLVVATTPAATDNLYDANLTGVVAFVLGNEGAGLSPALIQACGLTIAIPMPGNTESLNAAAAAAVCLFEKVRQDLK